MKMKIEKNNSIKKMLLTAFAVGWMALIFVFSAQPAPESTEVSQSVGRLVCGIFVPGFSDWPEEKQMEYAEMIDVFVRKTAHAAEYAVLALAVAGMLGAYGLDGRRRLVVSFVAAAAYAVSDEFHQLFVPGRSCQASDMMIDAAGAFAGCFLFWVAGKWRAARRRKRACAG